MVISLLPGDERQRILGELLAADGISVIPYEPGQHADAWLFPLPTGMHPVLSELPESALALTGQAKGSFPQLRIRDYFVSEAVQQKNAAITAEAALQTAQAGWGRVWNGAKVCILGFGRIGQALAPRLRALGSSVTVYARRSEQRAVAEGLGCTAIAEPQIPGETDLVFNTIPAPILLSVPDCRTVELASAPGGFPESESVLVARGLPGKYAPASAAEVLYDSVSGLLREEGLL